MDEFWMLSVGMNTSVSMDRNIELYEEAGSRCNWVWNISQQTQMIDVCIVASAPNATTGHWWVTSWCSLETFSSSRNYVPYEIAQRYSAWLWAGWSGVQVLARVWYFSLHHRVQTGSRAHPASYPMGVRGSFSGGKAAEAWSWPLTSI
jgi:hypothetical protein